MLHHHSCGHYCGYVVFPARFTVEDGYNGLLTYVPVHGGITFAEERADKSMAYGFDCNHCDDAGKDILRDRDWLVAECERMAIGIVAAKQCEQDYLLSADSEAKSAVIRKYHEHVSTLGADFDLQDNFGAMIRVFCGEL